MTGRGYFKVVDHGADGSYMCHPLHATDFDTSHLRITLPWRKVGVTRFDRVDDTVVEAVQPEEVTGKLVQCGEILTEWLPEWLKDSKRDY